MQQRNMDIVVREQRGKATIRGKIMRNIMRLTFNMSPTICKNPIKVMRKLNLLNFNFSYRGFERKKLTIGDCNFLFYSKKGGEHKNCIYVVHGGGYLSGLCWLYTRMTKHLSKAGHGADVLFVDYHCAPESEFPLMIDETYSGWEWLIQNGYKPDNIVTIGDSAGAHLQFNLMFRLRQLNMKCPKAIVALSPWLDMTAMGDTYISNSKVDVMFGSKTTITLEIIDKLLASNIFSFAYNKDRQDPTISPVYADYTGFPPTLIMSGGDEMLLSDSLTIA